MNYKETLFFIGKCLTVNHEEQNKILVEKDLKSDKVDWDSIVKVSTGHYVFPALYCNLKKADFLHYVPDDLVEYMEHIADLNRERNEQTIEQAKEINELLLSHNITPIFLKGTGNLLEDLYDDIAERMVGDIDFLVDEKDYSKTIDILERFSYSKVHEKNMIKLPDFRHYFRLKKENRIAAVEIHRGLTNEKYHKYFNFSHVKDDLLSLKETSFLSYKNQLCLSIIANQINDNGQHYNNIALRNAYDVFLLSQKINSLEAIKNLKPIFNPLNNFLVICKYVLNSNLIYLQSNPHTNITLKKFNKVIKGELNHKKITRTLFIKERLDIIYNSLFKKEYRKWIIQRLSDKQWQKEKLIQLGLKKFKPNS